MQLRHAAGLLFLQAGAQQVGEQVVIAPPAAHLVQRHQEQARPLHLLQQRLAALAAGNRVAQRAGQPLQHRGLQQERPYVLALLFEDLLGQVVQDVPVAAGERGHESGGIVLSAQRQRGQLQPRCPALGPGRQRRHRRAGEGRGDLLEQRRCFSRGEPQVGGAHLGQLAARPQPRQSQRRIAAAGQHHAYPGRPVLEQERERLVHLRRADHVVVIKDQQGLIRGQFVDQGRDQPLERRRRGRPEQRGDPFGDPGPGPVQRGHRVAPEPGRVVVPRVQRQPRGRVPAGPFGQQHRLAVSGRRAGQDEPSPPALIEPFSQARPGHQVRPRRGPVQLGREQDITLGLGRRELISHR